MKLTTTLSAIILSMAATATVSTAATAQAHGVQAARAHSGHEADALKTRVATVQARIAEGRRGGKVSRVQASRLDRQVAQVRTNMTRMNSRQGFISAAELATYNRSLGGVDVALDGYGVPRGYGNDGLVAPRRSR